MKRHPFALAFSPRRMVQPDSNVRRAPTLPLLPASTKPARWGNEAPQFADDLLVGAISHLLRHEETGQTEEQHDVSESVLTCVLALCEFFEEYHDSPVSNDETLEVLEFRSGQILRLLEVAGGRGQSVYSLMQATELDEQGVLDCIRILQRANISIRAELDYARDLELLFILETRLPKIGGAR